MIEKKQELHVVSYNPKRCAKKVCVVREVNELKDVIKNLLRMLVAIKGIDDYALFKTEHVLKGLENLNVFVEVKK